MCPASGIHVLVKDGNKDPVRLELLYDLSSGRASVEILTYQNNASTEAVHIDNLNGVSTGIEFHVISVIFDR
jgi:hypothetical protein